MKSGYLYGKTPSSGRGDSKEVYRRRAQVNRRMRGELRRQRMAVGRDNLVLRSFGMGTVILAVLAFLVVLAGAFIILCRADTIKVYGNSYYSTQEILDSIGIEEGDSLYLYNKYGKIQTMCREKPYIREVSIRRKLPDTLVVNIVEETPFYAAETDNGYWILTLSGKLLERVAATSEEAQNIAGLRRVYGINFSANGEEPAAGRKLSEFDTLSATALTGLSEAMQKEELLSSLSAVDLSTSYNLKILYEARLVVRFGMPANMEKKMIYLEEVLPEIGQEEYGTLDVSGEELRFVRSETLPEFPTETDDGGLQPGVGEPTTWIAEPYDD